MQGGCGPQAHKQNPPFPREGGRGMGRSGLRIVADTMHRADCPAAYHLYFMAMAMQFWWVGSTFLLPWVMLP